ncbi:hypothetical protein CHLRE_17g699200v5 [Chlamydomonas reinhardtii]|uniref:Ubiquitin-like domain-containing protein n=1 Tax=Chlamydomonas reinhardtii TaxID=3055 RepID=A0A2K3CNU0_CHLRE|nr:uncharacterized protein CHLRE_17g699200v5 [Chlamydomonas reinhardtii]PNW69947.1 hypothetical protein CHLRE_17g699200v5 [Chlamydomonas reinhardtii]
MRLFVKGLDGATVAVDVGSCGGGSNSGDSCSGADDAAGSSSAGEAAAAAAACGGSVAELMAAVEARLGVPAADQVLTTLGGRPLRPAAAAAAATVNAGAPATAATAATAASGDLATAWGLRPYDTLQLSVRLRGGQPVKVKVLTPTPKVECGAQVTVDLEPHTPLRSVKLQLAAATGLPVGRQRVMLGGIGSLVLIDKSSNIGASYCGSTNNLYFATLPATEAPVEQPPAKPAAATAATAAAATGAAAAATAK